MASVYYIGRAYYYFRKTGGIKGVARTGDLPEEQFANQVGNVANVAGGALSNALDKDEKAHAKADADHAAV